MSMPETQTAEMWQAEAARLAETFGADVLIGYAPYDAPGPAAKNSSASLIGRAVKASDRRRRLARTRRTLDAMAQTAREDAALDTAVAQRRIGRPVSPGVLELAEAAMARREGPRPASAEVHATRYLDRDEYAV